MCSKPRTFAAVGLVMLLAASCGVAAPSNAAVLGDREIPAATVNALATDDAFAALVGLQSAEGDAVVPGSTARAVLDVLLQGEALGILAERNGLDVEVDEGMLRQTVEGMAAQGYTFTMDDLTPEARDVLGRFLAVDRALAEAQADLGTPDEADLRFVYDALADTGRWQETCVTIVGGPPDLADEVESALSEGTELVEIPGEVEGWQVAVDAAQQCATGADLATLPGDLADRVEGAEVGALVGPVELETAAQPLAVYFKVAERSTIDFEEARQDLEPLVSQSLLSVMIARNAEVDPRYGGPVELEVTQGRPGPSGQPGGPVLVARVSRPEAPVPAEPAVPVP